VSDILYNDPAYKRDWREIAVHDGCNIKGFFGYFRFLSNFEKCLVEYEGMLYPSSENAYQAAKVAPDARKEFQTCSAAESKTLWKKLPPIYTPATWDDNKLTVMRKVVFDKFLRNDDLRNKLLDTGGRYLEETLWWRDNFWGVDVVIGGENNLGKILMQTRKYFQT